MGLQSLCGRVLLGLSLSLLLSTFCIADDNTIKVVGFGECADCKENNINTIHALSGLHVSIDCKLANGEIKTSGEGELDQDGKFEVSLPKEMMKDGKLKEECYAQLHSASSAPCPAHNGIESSKIVSIKTDGKNTLKTAGNLKFSTPLCTSAFLWPYFKYPQLPPFPKDHSWMKKFPKLPPFPPMPPLGHPFPLPPIPPFFKKPCPPPLEKPLPPPVPVYNPTPKPTPVVKPLPPPVPVYKPKPKPPPVPVYKPKPKPPPVPVYKPKPKPPPVPVYKPGANLIRPSDLPLLCVRAEKSEADSSIFFNKRKFFQSWSLKMLQNVQHQLLQSPARLGLPTPSSPSLQNTTPPTKFSSQASQPNQQANILTTTTTSSTLLPLLPPLSRAQSLLIQMASLASRLFEVSPNRSHWLSAFRGSFPSFLPSTAPVPQDSSPSSSKEILSAFTSLQTQLFEAVAELQEILDLQDEKQKVTREIRSNDSAILAFANKLKGAEHVLDNLVDDYADYRRPKRAKLENDTEESSLTSVATQLKLSDILSYAHRISYTTFAPPEFGGGQAPLRGALPPAPQDEQLRASQLYIFADLDVGLPKTDEGKENILEPLIEPPAESNPLANLSSIQGLVPPNIVVPSGWKPGMPVELPTDLPLPPPGWKPGDPIALPPVDSRPPQKVEEAPARPVPPPGLSRMPEPIQVRHVQLDIDDDSSDYSSDEASSDSED